MTSDVALAHLASAVWPHGFASTVHAAVQGVVQGAQLSSRLQYLFFQAAAKFAGSLGVVQAWMPIVGPMDPTMQGFSDVTLFADTNLLILGDPKFQEFRNCSCQTPLQYKNSMPGRVWRTGAVQVVQNLRIVPPSLHPRSHLSEEHLDRLAEVLYIPVYDQLRPAQGPVAVLEAFMASHSAQAVIAADFLSFVGQALAPLQLSVANPLPQPIRRSALCGRRARGDQSAPDMSNQAPAGPVACGAPGQGPDAGARPVSPAPTGPQGPALTDGRPQPSPLPHYTHLTQSTPQQQQQQQQQATGGVAEASSQLHWAQVAAAQAAAGQGPRAPSPCPHPSSYPAPAQQVQARGMTPGPGWAVGDRQLGNPASHAGSMVPGLDGAVARGHVVVPPHSLTPSPDLPAGDQTTAAPVPFELASGHQAGGRASTLPLAAQAMPGLQGAGAPQGSSQGPVLAQGVAARQGSAAAGVLLPAPASQPALPDPTMTLSLADPALQGPSPQAPLAPLPSHAGSVPSPSHAPAHPHSSGVAALTHCHQHSLPFPAVSGLSDPGSRSGSPALACSQLLPAWAGRAHQVPPPAPFPLTHDPRPAPSGSQILAAGTRQGCNSTATTDSPSRPHMLPPTLTPSRLQSDTVPSPDQGGSSTTEVGHCLAPVLHQAYEADGGEGMEDEEDEGDDDDDEEEEELPAKVRRIMVRSKSMLAVTHWPGPRVEDAS